MIILFTYLHDAISIKQHFSWYFELVKPWQLALFDDSCGYAHHIFVSASMTQKWHNRDIFHAMPLKIK